MSIKLRPKLQKAFLLQILSNVLYALFNRPFVSINVDLGLLRSFIRGRYARELWYIEYKTRQTLTLDLARPCLLVQALGIALFTLFDTSVHIYFHERQRGIVLFVQFTRKFTVSLVR